MKIVVMIDKSAGNESVGSMWTETYIFEETATLGQVVNKLNLRDETQIHETVKIQIAEEVSDGNPRP